MISTKVLLTYKRRRFSSPSCANGCKARSSSKYVNDPSPDGVTPKFEYSGRSEKLSEDNVYCLKCGTFDINEDLLGCDTCNGSYHFKCINFSLENKWQCPVCAKEQNVEDTMDWDVRENAKKGSLLDGSEKEQLKCNAEDMSRMVNLDSGNASVPFSDTLMTPQPSITFASEIKNKGERRISHSQISDLNIAEETCPDHSNLSTEKHSCDLTPGTQTLDMNINCPSGFVHTEAQNRIKKDSLRAPLITFSRRVKKKKSANELMMEKNFKAVAPSRDQTALDPLNVTPKDADSVVPKNGLEAPSAGVVEKTIPGMPNKDLHSEKAKEPNLSQPREPSDMARGAAQATVWPSDPVLLRGGDIGSVVDITIPQPAFTSPSNTGHVKSSKEVVQESLLVLQNSSTPHGRIVLDEEMDNRGKGLDWLIHLDDCLRDSPKDLHPSHAALFKGHDLIDGRPLSNCGTSFAAPVVPSAHGPVINQVASRDKGLHQDGPKSSSVCCSFQNLSLPFNSKSINHFADFSRSGPSASAWSVKDNVHIYDRRLSGLALNSVPSLPKREHLADNVLTQRLRETHGCLLENFRRYSKEWSEEELDFLWIGVRRYGMCRWNVMLKDPKLCFLASRNAEDLAARWELEQRKLLNGTFAHPELLGAGRSSPPLANEFFARMPSGSHYDRYGSRVHTNSVFQKLPEEAVLSLGDVYLRRENLYRRTPSHPPSSEIPLDGSAFISNSSRCSTSRVEIGHHRPAKLPIVRHPCEQSSSLLHKLAEPSGTQGQQPDVQPATISCLPHWLKDVPPTGLAEQAIPQSTSGGKLVDDERTHTPAAIPNERSARQKPSRRLGALKRSSVKSKAMEADINRRAPARATSNDLVIIGTDASSEGTISDNQTTMV